MSLYPSVFIFDHPGAADDFHRLILPEYPTAELRIAGGLFAIHVEY